MPFHGKKRKRDSTGHALSPNFAHSRDTAKTHGVASRSAMQNHNGGEQGPGNSSNGTSSLLISSTEKRHGSRILEKQKQLVQSRAELPIYPHASGICEALSGTRDVLILVGETGSGKSTQVPQFLLEEVWCKGMIAITQPRRVAAISLARRVADEMGTTLGSSSPASRVGYSVRFDQSVAPATKVKYLTDGMLLQELLRDPWLSKYSLVILDEIHERGVNIDILLGIIRNIVTMQSADSKKARKGAGRLKVIVMSATADVEKLLRYFEQGFNNDTDVGSSNAVQVATNDEDDTVLDVPSQANMEQTETDSWSGISDNEVDRPEPPSSSRLEQHERQKQAILQQKKTVVSQYVSTFYVEGRQHPVEIFFAPEPPVDFVEAALRTIFQIHHKEPLPGDILVFLTGQDTVEALETLVNEFAMTLDSDVPKILALPLFAALSQNVQARIFEPAPRNTRKVIIATNIAETSVTIPGIVHVVDCGLAKVKEYRSALGLDSLLIKPISKSSAIQRKGRAGRERPGKCWRLYTEKEYLKLDAKNSPEILRCDLSSALLTMKARGIQDVVNFPLLDPPGREHMRRALITLIRLNAIDETGRISDIGKKMARLPLTPMLSRVIIAASKSSMPSIPTEAIMADVVDIVASLGVEGLFLPLHTEEVKEEAQAARRELLHREGDHLTLLATVRACARDNSDRRAWCEQRLVSHRAMRQALDVRKQLRAQCIGLKLVGSDAFERADAETDRNSDRGDIMSERHTAVLRCFLAGFARNVARLQADGSYRPVDGGANQPISIHPGSVLFGRKVEAIMYDELIFTSRCWARGVSAIRMDWYVEAVGAAT